MQSGSHALARMDARPPEQAAPRRGPLRGFIAALRWAYLRRRTVRELRDLSDDLLWDIGLTRAQVEQRRPTFLDPVH